MRIRFDPEFDGGAWPGPLADRDAVAGEAWFGELGLLAALETALGLSGLDSSSGERAAALVPALHANEGFWSRSGELDPLGSAREVLRWRDELVLAGWRGETRGAKLPDRVVALAALEGGILAGVPDRLRRVVDALSRRSAEFESVGLLETEAGLPPLWRQAVAGLRAHGTAVREIGLGSASATGDLAAARANGFAPNGDGSIQLIRSDGPWAAAVELAAWLASQDFADETVVVSPTPLLDTELRRFGLPVTGAREVRGGSTLLEVLPLVLSLGWQPASPSDAAALLSLPESPVPRGIRSRLARALAKWPAVGSDVWNQALKEGLDTVEDRKQRTRLEERLTGIFDGPVPRTGSGYPTSELHKRTGLVRDWLRGRRAMLGESTEGDLSRALSEALLQCTAFERIVELAGLSNWRGADLQRFLDEARSSLAAEPVLGAEAGVASVAAPGAVVGPAKCVVWWDFSRERAPRLERLPFSRAETAQLEAAGITLEAPADRAVRHAARWRRPLDQATETLVLVAPRSNERGDESHPHPLWDEIGARIDRSASGGVARDVFLAGRHYAEPRAGMQRQPLKPPPAPLREWQIAPRLVPLPDRASHAAIEDLLRCPLRWALRRIAGLEGPAEIEVGISNLVLGNLAHALLEVVLPEAEGDPAKARALAESWFELEGPKRLAALFLPGSVADQARVAQILVDGAGLLTEFANQAGLELRAAEEEIEGSGLGRALFGVPDLIFGPKPVVVDVKWGGLSHRRSAIEAGTATQLAFYAHLLGQQSEKQNGEGFDGTAAAVAFFVLSRGRILTTDAEIGGQAETLPGPSHEETWLALERAFDSRKEELANGVVTATANPDPAGTEKNVVLEKDGVSEAGLLQLKPNCQWCEYGALCGAGLAEGSEGGIVA